MISCHVNFDTTINVKKSDLGHDTRARSPLGGVKVIFEVKELSVTALHRQGEGCSRAYHEAGPCTEHHKTVQMRTDGPKFFCALRYVLTR